MPTAAAAAAGGGSGPAVAKDRSVFHRERDGGDGVSDRDREHVQRPRSGREGGREAWMTAFSLLMTVGRCDAIVSSFSSFLPSSHPPSLPPRLTAVSSQSSKPCCGLAPCFPPPPPPPPPPPTSSSLQPMDCEHCSSRTARPLPLPPWRRR